MSDVKTPVRRRRWWLVLILAVVGGLGGLVAGMLAVNSSMDAISNGQGELRVSVCGIRLHEERGPWQPLEQKMFAYGWSVIGGFAAAGLLLGAGMGLPFSRLKSH